MQFLSFTSMIIVYPSPSDIRRTNINSIFSVKKNSTKSKKYLKKKKKRTKVEGFVVYSVTSSWI